MTSNTIKFVHLNKIVEIDDPDSNETILNYIRTKLKKNRNQGGLCRRRLWSMHNSIRRIKKR